VLFTCLFTPPRSAVASRHPATGGQANASPISRIGGERERTMPRYEFLCETCDKSFELIMTIAEREKAKPKCPNCKGTKVVPQFGGFMAQTSKKS
jgi:putative FmdB family regulatory protein